MKNIQSPQDNRREHMRVKSRMHFCVSIIESVDQETGAFIYGNCFCTVTADLSLGGMCVAHTGKVQAGFDVEISTPSKMVSMTCLSCDKAYLYKNDLDLEPIYGKIIWATKDRCGISFNKITRRNENILSKFIWDEHLTSVRSNKKEVARQKKF